VAAGRRQDSGGRWQVAYVHIICFCIIQEFKAVLVFGDGLAQPEFKETKQNKNLVVEMHFVPKGTSTVRCQNWNGTYQE
jgi:hypothetical protein